MIRPSPNEGSMTFGVYSLTVCDVSVVVRAEKKAGRTRGLDSLLLDTQVLLRQLDLVPTC